MKFSELLRSTGAVREYSPESVGDAVIAAVLDDARFAPSGGNRQAWRVIVVTDPSRRQRIGDLYQQVWREYLAQRARGLRPFSPVNDPAVETEITELVGRGDGPPAGDFARRVAEAPVILAVLISIEEIAAVDKDLGHYPIVGGASIYPFVHNILLAARDHGLGGVMTTVLTRREPEMLKILGAPDTMALASVVLLGYPAGPWPRPTRKPVSAFTTRDYFDGEPLRPTNPPEVTRR